MVNPFEELAKKQKEAKDTPDKPAEDKGMFTKTQIKEMLTKSQKPKKSSICAIYVGHPKGGKTGTALDCRTEEDKALHKKVICFELNNDQGCGICKKEHFNDDPDIVVLDNLREYSMDTKGKWVPDYIRTMEKIKATLQELKDNTDEYNMKAIVFDGLDIFLSEICEKQMRMDEHIDVSGGVSMRFWLKRNSYYFEAINLLFDIDVDKYFITHYAGKRRDDKGEFNDDRFESILDKNLVFACQKSTPDKMHQIVEFTDKTTIVKGVKNVELVATVICDRRSLDFHMTPITIAKTNPDTGKVEWSGQAILEKK